MWRWGGVQSRPVNKVATADCGCTAMEPVIESCKLAVSSPLFSHCGNIDQSENWLLLMQQANKRAEKRVSHNETFCAVERVKNPAVIAASHLPVFFTDNGMMRISFMNNLAKGDFYFLIRRGYRALVSFVNNVQRSAKIPKRDWTRDVSQKLSKR